MARLIQSIEEGIHHRRLLKPGEKILVAVSGGVDSMVLLHVLNELSVANHWRLCVAHLNHRLRGRSSDADQKLVKKAAKRLRLKCVVGRRDVRGLRTREKISLEMAARKARHEFLAASARRFGARTIALAHHADDQIELFFMRLLRGSGPEGLGAMKWRSKSPVAASIHLVRPLLGVSKSSLYHYAKGNQIPYREDRSNQSLDILRNRIRHELLPLLKRRYQPALETTVGRAIELLQDESDFVQNVARAASSGNNFDQLDMALQRRVLQAQLLGLGVSPDFDLIEQLRLKPTQAVCIGVGEKDTPIRLARNATGIVSILPASQERHTFSPDTSEVLLLKPEGSFRFNGLALRWEVQQQKHTKNPAKKTNVEVFDAAKVGLQIILRHWRRGDRFQPIGMGTAVKIQDFFTNEKVPRQKRHQLVLATTANGEVFWIEGMRISERFKLTKRTIRRLQWSWERF